MELPLTSPLLILITTTSSYLKVANVMVQGKEGLYLRGIRMTAGAVATGASACKHTGFYRG